MDTCAGRLGHIVSTSSHQFVELVQFGRRIRKQAFASLGTQSAQKLFDFFAVFSALRVDVLAIVGYAEPPRFQVVDESLYRAFVLLVFAHRKARYVQIGILRVHGTW